MDELRYKVCRLTIEKIAEKLKQEHFLKKYFHAIEIDTIKRKKSKAMQIQSLSARLAAKFAYAQLKKRDNKHISFNTMCIVNNEIGKPVMYFYDEDGKNIDGSTDQKVLVSLSHTRKYAAGFVILND